MPSASLTDLADQLHGPAAHDPASPAWASTVDQFLVELHQRPPADEVSLARVEQALVFCLAQPQADIDQIGNLALSLLFNHQVVDLLDRAMAIDPSGRNLWFLSDPTLRRLMLSPLLPALLALRPVTNSHGERLLTAIRHGLLLDLSGKRLLEGEHWRLLTHLLNAMAVQGAMTEYAWAIEPGELETLAPLIAALPSSPDAEALPVLLLAGCYQPLTSWVETQTLIMGDEATLHALGVEAALFDWHLKRPADQRRHAEAIERRGQFHGAVSEGVGQHYEENPYPRWSRLPTLPALGHRQYLAHDLGYDPAGVPDRLNGVLVAGCGTGRHPLQLAMLLPDQPIDAMDLSRASLGYAAMMAARYGLGDRLTLFQGDILDLPNLGARYDLIESAGVIHHMADPAAGLAALNACLSPGGWLRLALYSETARRDIRALRDTYGQGQDLGDFGTLRQLRQTLMANPSEAAKAVVNMADFYTLSGFRDLAFHRQEHRYTIPMLAEMLSAEGLEFMGFSFPDASVRVQYRDQYPNDPNMLSLENWHGFEQANPDTFLAMYNFWCRKPS